MTSGKLVVAALLAAVALLPVGIEASQRSSREKSRQHRTRSEKSARQHATTKNKRDTKSGSEREEFERRWDEEQVEPDLPESE